MHQEPLESGQEFSFVDETYVAEYHGPYQSSFLDVDAETFASHSDHKRLISPSERLIVLDDLYISGDAWYVKAELSGLPGTVAFRQLVGPEAAKSFFPSYRQGMEQKGARAVTDVRWPEPSPASLVFQVRALSYWRNGSARSRERTNNPVPWRKCEDLSQRPLEQGLALAVEWLGGYIADPSTALRQRGFII